MLQEIEKEDHKNWELTRDERVSSWRQFNKLRTTDKKEKRKRMMYEIKAPAVRMEERPASAPKNETTKPMGITDDYRRLWK
jgi:ABC-type ATPase with predicted acetyltransferase domain